MHAQFQAMHLTEAEVIGLIDAPDLKHVLGANGDAIPLAFATFQIDDRRNHTRLLFAVAC
ncbi:hypothetical protein WK43_00825 [Burkholderia ubonensis]|uniref:Uncharacterized protein n=1 Tax=Burkholderia ubonensis TaxID=101571 RepID=A0A108JRE9_9BURK|nr:hypothetical protein WK37_26375 [Burkholderia ubonensis]KVS46613.1 hypothetical protein WK38_01125 [Burkholderia ubonensis]KVS84029.1 hypothetical protein WK42_07770 [Burkholderia ubonensis]KVS92757.1 hypothetical protein WK44_12155 [Burkholderia ubonensis]KVS93377.1 hypothetical protein WK45_17825 [Burkholderia ubonensis]